MTTTAKRKPRPNYVPWNQLTPAAQAIILSSGHPSNRPKPEDCARPGNKFAEDGSGWMDYYALAGFFPSK